jgi:hypothetical protein
MLHNSNNIAKRNVTTGLFGLDVSVISITKLQNSASFLSGKYYDNLNLFFIELNYDHEQKV